MTGLGSTRPLGLSTMFESSPRFNSPREEVSRRSPPLQTGREGMSTRGRTESLQPPWLGKCLSFPPSFTYVLVSNLAVRGSAQCNYLWACCGKTSGSEGPNHRCHSIKTRRCLDSRPLDNDLARYQGLFGLILKSRAVRITRLANY